MSVAYFYALQVFIFDRIKIVEVSRSMEVLNVEKVEGPRETLARIRLGVQFPVKTSHTDCTEYLKYLVKIEGDIKKSGSSRRKRSLDSDDIFLTTNNTNLIELGHEKVPLSSREYELNLSLRNNISEFSQTTKIDGKSDTSRVTYDHKDVNKVGNNPKFRIYSDRKSSIFTEYESSSYHDDVMIEDIYMDDTADDLESFENLFSE